MTFAADPFSLGVASGDPDAHERGAVDQTGPEPARPGRRDEARGGAGRVGGGRGRRDEEGRRPRHRRSPPRSSGHTVHAEARGLKPDRWYWYRFRAGDAVSPVGRTRTLPAADAAPEKLKFAFASCQHYEQGLFTAYEQMAKDDLDLVFHLGDYIYEYPGARQAGAEALRAEKVKIKSLADYRERHMQYRADPLLHGMHARCPWFVTWDDHEFDNNYANECPGGAAEGRREGRPGRVPGCSGRPRTRRTTR